MGPKLPLVTVIRQSHDIQISRGYTDYPLADILSEKITGVPSLSVLGVGSNIILPHITTIILLLYYYYSSIQDTCQDPDKLCIGQASAKLGTPLQGSMMLKDRRTGHDMSTCPLM